MNKNGGFTMLSSNTLVRPLACSIALFLTGCASMESEEFWSGVSAGMSGMMSAMGSAGGDAAGASAAVFSGLATALLGPQSSSITAPSAGSSYSETQVASTPQSCEPLPPSCKRASDHGVGFVNKVKAGGISGIVDAASQQYCVLLVGIEVNNVCAAEYRQLGNYTCANLTNQQSSHYRQALPQTAAAASTASIQNARNKCTFEL